MRLKTPLITSLAAALIVTGNIAAPLATSGDNPVPPPVPIDLEVPAGNTAYLIGHSYGTQNYSCLPTATGYAWTLYGPQATLFNDDNDQIITHFLSPNPEENGTPRA